MFHFQKIASKHFTIFLDWFPIVKLGAVNCADKVNSDFCTKQNITGVPALKVNDTIFLSAFSLTLMHNY